VKAQTQAKLAKTAQIAITAASVSESAVVTTPSSVFS
jgi:hypothetical protein